jgi:hypothetical protein
MQKLYLFLLLLPSLFINSGCSPITNKYRVNIDAITAPNLKVSPTSFTIKALGKNTDTNSLLFQEQSSYLVKLLLSKGYTQASSSLEAKQIIYFDYGIDKLLEEVETYNEPEVMVGVSVGAPYGFYRRRHYNPFWGNWGYYRSYSKRYNYYNRYLTLLAKNQLGRELWRIDVSSIGESKNLKKIVPILLEASVPYIGKNTKEPVKVIIKEKTAKEE